MTSTSITATADQVELSVLSSTAPSSSSRADGSRTENTAGRPSSVNDVSGRERSRGEEEPGAAQGNITVAIPDGGYGWTIVAASSFLAFWLNGYTTAWGVFQTAMLRSSSSLQTDLRTITFVGSLYLAILAGFGLFSVRVMRRVGVRWMGSTATAMFGLGLAATSFVLENLGALFVVAAGAVGLASSMVFVATNCLTVQWFSGHLGVANGVVKMGGGIGATVMPLIIQALIDRVGIRWTFRVLGGMILLTGAPAALLLRERDGGGGVASRGGGGSSGDRFEWRILKNSRFVALTLAGAIGVFAMYVPPYFLPLVASSIGLSSSVGAGLVAGFGAATAVGRLLGGWLCDRAGSVNALAVTMCVNCLSLLAIWPVSRSLPPLMLFALINGCANGSFFVVLPTAAAMVVPGSPAASISLMTAFWAPGYLLGAPLAGVLIEAGAGSGIQRYWGAIFYAAGTGAVAMGLVLGLRLRMDKKIWKKL